jgi:cell division protein FtsW
MIAKQQYNYSDLTTLFCVMILMGMSVLVVYTASSSWALQKFGKSEYLLTSHVFKVFIAIVALFIGMNINYQNYKKFTRGVLIIASLLLLFTLVLGGEVKGAVRFLRFGSIGFQPSEFAKFALIFHLSTMLVTKKESVLDFKKGYLPMVLWVGIISGLVMIQPNFSTGSMILLISFILIFIGSIRLKHIVLTVAPLIPIVLIYMVSASYRWARVEAFVKNFSLLLTLNSNAIKESGYQLWQGIIGFGNGGILGVGLGNSKQRDLFLPESYGDFIFSIVGEEYGILGTLFFMTLFFLILWRGFKIARYAQDDYGKFLAYGITITITVYALINASVTLGLLPTTGLSMPFVSYGGSSIVFSAYAIGVLLNISKQTDLHPKLSRIPVVGTIDADGRINFEEK